MLPPFVPPSARAQTESLPLITEFVLARTERPFGQTPAAAMPAMPRAAAHAPSITGTNLPFITEFLADEAETQAIAPEREAPPAHQGSAPASIMALAANSGLGDAKESASDAERSSPYAEASPSLTGTSSSHADTGSSDAGDASSHAEAPVASADELMHSADVTIAHVESVSAEESITYEPEDEAAAEVSPYVTYPADAGSEPPSPAAGWVDEERNAFDWHSVASLAPNVDEQTRADEEWTSTDWEQTEASPAEHAASILSQLARRVRAGELHVDIGRGASTEATLASVLAALLAEPETDGR